jgi:hypothetical protein
VQPARYLESRRFDSGGGNMPKTKRKGGSAKIDPLSREHFTFRKTAYHGFPKDATAMAFEPHYSLLYIGTKNGELRVYPPFHNCHSHLPPTL